MPSDVTVERPEGCEEIQCFNPLLIGRCLQTELEEWKKNTDLVSFNPLLIGRCLQTDSDGYQHARANGFQPPTNREMPSDSFFHSSPTAGEYEFQPPTNREMPSDPISKHTPLQLTIRFNPLLIGRCLQTLSLGLSALSGVLVSTPY